MISKENRLIITFNCTTDAIAMEKLCKSTNTPGRLIPVPRNLSASCGLSWCALPQERSVLEELLHRYNLKPEGIYTCLL